MKTEPKTPVFASQAKPWLALYDPKFIGRELPACSVFDYICQKNKGHLTDIALNYYGNQISYAGLIVNVKKTAAAFRALGLRKGEIVTVVSVMTPEIIYSFYAASMLGITLNLVDPRYSVEGIRAYIQEVDSRFLVCLNVTYEKCREAIKRTPVEKVLVLSPADSLKGALRVGYTVANPDCNRYASNVVLWKDFLAAGQNRSTDAEPYDPNHCCVIVHTGGTTGSPKGVMLGDTAFNALAQQFEAYEKVFARQQRYLDVMPPFIAYGFACGVHMPLALGVTVILIPNLDPAKLGSLVRKYKPSHMCGVPSHYQVLAADPKMKRADLSFVLNYAAGGDAIPLGAEQSVNEFLAAHHAPYALSKGYGMTEVCSAASVAVGHWNKPGSVGLPMVDTVIAAFEPGTDRELPLGERGELCITGPAVMQGYYNKPDETANILRRHRDGRLWIHSGDLGYLDEEGYVFVDSRIKRMIIRHDGFKVFPSMIENVLSRHPAVQNCSVVGCADKKHLQGRLPFAYIELAPAWEKKKRMVIQELRQLCTEELPEYMLPAGYKLVDALPYTPIGKVDYRALEQALAAQED